MQNNATMREIGANFAKTFTQTSDTLWNLGAKHFVKELIFLQFCYSSHGITKSDSYRRSYPGCSAHGVEKCMKNKNKCLGLGHIFSD